MLIKANRHQLTSTNIEIRKLHGCMEESKKRKIKIKHYLTIGNIMLS